MKLSPKGVTFCPGCPKKELKLESPSFNTQIPEKDTKKITIISKPTKKKLRSLF